MDMSLEDNSLEELANRIQSNTSVICNFLRSKSHPQPSFRPESPAKFPQAPENVSRARNDLIADSLMLHYLALWPAPAIEWYSNSGFLNTSSITWLCHFQVPQAVPLEHSVSFDELAVACKVDEKQLRSVLRHAMTNAWFCEPENGQVAHTAMSKLIVTDEALRAQILYRGKVAFPSSAKLIEATKHLGGQPTTSNAAFNVAFGTTMPSLLWASQSPDIAPLLTGLMRAYQGSSAHGVTHLVDGYDWNGLGTGTVVDVGGNEGSVSLAIAAEAPNLRFVVQDQPKPIAEGIARLPPDMQHRVNFQVHDFFQENPVKEPTAFLLRFVLHDWPDEEAIRILRCLVPNMTAGTKLIIVDTVVQPPEAMSFVQKKSISKMDLTMQIQNHGRERTQDDWEELIQKADSSLKITRILKPHGDGDHSILEVERPFGGPLIEYYETCRSTCFQQPPQE